MCPSIALLGDIGTDHDGFPPTPVIRWRPTTNPTTHLIRAALPVGWGRYW